MSDAESYTREALVRDLVKSISQSEGTPVFPGINSTAPRATRLYALELVAEVIRSVDGIKTDAGS